MKKNLFFGLLLGAVLIAGCHSKSEKTTAVETSHVEGLQAFLTVGENGDTMYMKALYDIDWPREGQLTEAALRTLTFASFGNSTLVSPQHAALTWAQRQTTGETDLVWTPTEHIDDTIMSNDAELKITCRQQGRLLTYTVFSSYFPIGAAHGWHDVECVTVDVTTGRVVRLADLLDTNQLGRAVATAIRDLEPNREVQDCLFDEFQTAEQLPLPQTFFVDSTRSNIVVTYGLYAVAPYSCGLQSVVLPADWLSSQVRLTKYAEQLLK